MSYTIWLTGRQNSGKSTLGRLLAIELSTRVPQVRHLNAHNIDLNLLLGTISSIEDRHIANLRIAWIARFLNEHGVLCIVEEITPFIFDKKELTSILPNYKKIFLDCSLELAINRGPKDYYEFSTKRQDDYEYSTDSHFILSTDRQTPTESLMAIILWLEAATLIPRKVKSDFIEQDYTVDEERLIKKRLKDLGYL